MPPPQPYEVFETNGCSIAIRRFAGPVAKEIFFSCIPDSNPGQTQQQADAVYRAVSDVLDKEGGSWACVTAETAFFSDIHSDLRTVRKLRDAVLAERSPDHQPVHALTELEQAPLAHESVAFASLIHAVVPERSPIESTCITTQGLCSCSECELARGLLLKVGEDTRFFAGNLYGKGSDSYEQTHAMFVKAERLLENADLSFSDVMRTWIYFSAMERDYDGFNRARRAFFYSREVDPIPASTGIGAGLASSEHSLALGIYAARGEGIRRSVMITPTLNEAPEYGSDFSRGMRVEESNRTTLLVSGTASLDETGATVHLNDLESQADRMLRNVAALLERQGASFADIVSAITYVKHPQDAPALEAKLSAKGYAGFPNVIVHAPVCRPELLCETEALAVVAKSGPAKLT